MRPRRRVGTSPGATVDGGVDPNRRHWQILLAIVVVGTAVIEPVLWFVIRVHMPPGSESTSAQGDQFSATVLTMMASPVVIAVVTYFLYSIIVWRQPKDGPLLDGPPIRSNFKVQASWIAITSAIVMSAFVFGTYELIAPAGAGGGEGPSPIWTPASQSILPVQVIGQQWQWTYRYPTYGGFETTQLVLPDHTWIAFHVTSLDVIHGFWAYQLGVKADANPAIDNVAFTKTRQTGKITVRCDELCGIWHGAMYDYGYVVSRAAFNAWARRTETRLAPLTKLLPKFAWSYVPSANGAAGGYYPSNLPIAKQYLYKNGSSGPEGNLPAVKVSNKGLAGGS
ncbi:MAG: cytochrome c oxidase subunit II [Acidimicrobiales bacterium]